MKLLSIKWIGLVFAWFLSIQCVAKNVGTVGEVYPIIEEDFIDFLQTRAANLEENGSYSALQNSMQSKVKAYRDRPTKVAGIEKTQNERNSLFDPSIVLDHGIHSSNGKMIALQGTRINPLVYIPLSKTLIFYDADDRKQHEWAMRMNKKLKGKTKIILINGSILEEEKFFSSPIYFDQSGRLVKRFGIEHVPATVEQDGLLLRIREVIP